MKVPPFNFPLENSVLKKINLMLDRCTQRNPKKDAVLLFEGAEGEGKTTYSIGVGYYAAWKTGRKFNHKNIFFDVKEMIEFLQSTDNQIAVWDEPALQTLSKDSLSTIVKDLERLLLMARKKRHFIMINISYFNKFSEYIVWQRPLGMIHVYSRRDLEPGRFVYIRKKNLEYLYYDWRRKHKRNYRRWCSKSIRGTFPDILNPDDKNNVLSDFDVNYYEKEKDKAIMKIGRNDKKEQKSELEKFKLKIVKGTSPREKEELSKKLGVSVRTIRFWDKKGRDLREIRENA